MVEPCTLLCASTSAGHAFSRFGAIRRTLYMCCTVCAFSLLRLLHFRLVRAIVTGTCLSFTTPQLLCLLNDDIPWGKPVCATNPGEGMARSCSTRLKRIGTRAGWVWRAYLRSLSCKALALICAVLSGVILWSEVSSLTHDVRDDHAYASQQQLQSYALIMC